MQASPLVGQGSKAPELLAPPADAPPDPVVVEPPADDVLPVDFEPPADDVPPKDFEPPADVVPPDWGTVVPTIVLGAPPFELPKLDEAPPVDDNFGVPVVPPLALTPEEVPAVLSAPPLLTVLDVPPANDEPVESEPEQAMMRQLSTQVPTSKRMDPLLDA